MAKLTENQQKTATVIGLQIASAVALTISMSHEIGEEPATTRENFLRICRELYDETASALELG